MWSRIGVDWLGLPADVVLDLPQIVCTGNVEVAVHNHRGLERFSPSVVTVRSSLGTVRVEGEELAVRRVTADAVAVTGRILAVRIGG